MDINISTRMEFYISSIMFLLVILVVILLRIEKDLEYKNGKIYELSNTIDYIYTKLSEISRKIDDNRK